MPKREAAKEEGLPEARSGDVSGGDGEARGGAGTRAAMCARCDAEEQEADLAGRRGGGGVWVVAGGAHEQLAATARLSVRARRRERGDACGGPGGRRRRRARRHHRRRLFLVGHRGVRRPRDDEAGRHAGDGAVVGLGWRRGGKERPDKPAGDGGGEQPMPTWRTARRGWRSPPMSVEAEAAVKGSRRAPADHGGEVEEGLDVAGDEGVDAFSGRRRHWASHSWGAGGARGRRSRFLSARASRAGCWRRRR